MLHLFFKVSKILRNKLLKELKSKNVAKQGTEGEKKNQVRTEAL